MFLGLQHIKGRGACQSSKMRLRRMTSNQSLTRTYTNQTTSWLVHSLSNFGAKTSHRQTWTHKTHHSPLTPEIPKVETLATLGAYNLVYKPLIEMRFKAKLQPSLKAFQQYVARHRHARKSGRFPAFRLVITYIRSVQMGHVSSLQTSRFQDISNDIRNVLILQVLTPAIAL